MSIIDPLPGLSKVSLLEALKERTQTVTSEILLPVRIQKGDTDEAVTERAAEIFIGRLPDTKQSTKKAPYILHQLVNSNNKQIPGEQLTSMAIVRSIFCVRPRHRIGFISKFPRLQVDTQQYTIPCSQKEKTEDIVISTDSTISSHYIWDIFPSKCNSRNEKQENHCKELLGS